MELIFLMRLVYKISWFQAFIKLQNKLGHQEVVSTNLEGKNLQSVWRHKSGQQGRDFFIGLVVLVFHITFQ